MSTSIRLRLLLRRRRYAACLALLSLASVACGERPSPAAGPDAGRSGSDAASVRPLLVEVDPGTGFDFVHWNGRTGLLRLAEITCGGGALLDVDGDGDLDLYLLQGALLGPGETLEEAIDRPAHAPPTANRLYRNELQPGGPLRFVDRTSELGALTPHYGCAVATGDVDNDGRVDLYLANLGPDQLLRNLGEGRFSDVTESAGLGDPGAGATAVFFDYDRDGWLDLFVGRYAAFLDDPGLICNSLTGTPDYCGPDAYGSQTDLLYRNRGDGTFEEVTRQAGLVAAARPALGAVALDVDGDRWLDLFVANDGEANYLWRNTGDGRFVEEGVLAGCAVNGSGAAEASMGVAAGDVDLDGRFDLFLTHLIKETSTLYRNAGDWRFIDATPTSGLGPPSLPYTSFGTGFLDVDGDGLLDLFVASGAVVLVPSQVAAGDSLPLHQRNQLFRNGADGRAGSFREVEGEPALERSEVSRGAAFGDVDNDGDTDVLVINNGGPARLLLDDGAPVSDSWLGVRLVDGEPARDQLGATAVLVRRDGTELWRRVASDGSFASASDPRVLFGLAGSEGAARLRVLWPDGSGETWPAPEPGRYVTIVRGSGTVAGRGR